MKNFLILIHPDAVIERGLDVSAKYLSALMAELPKFDIVVTHFLFSDNYPREYLYDTADVYDEIRAYLKSVSTKYIHDKSMGENSFQNDIFEIIVDNEDGGLNIYMSGGNQDLCLQESHDNFCKILGDIVNSNDKLNYKIYTPLIYRRLYQNSWNREKLKFEVEIPAGVGPRIPAGRKREYVGQNFDINQRFTDNGYWFEGIDSDELEKTIKSLHRLGISLKKESMQNEYNYIRYLISRAALNE
jgi:hypothetical protein